MSENKAPEAGMKCVHCGAEIAPSHPGRWVDEHGAPDCGLHARTVHEPYLGASLPAPKLTDEQIEKGRELLQYWIGSTNKQYWVDCLSSLARCLQYTPEMAKPKDARAFFEYLVAHDGPVVDGLEQHENVYAQNQPEYLPLRTLPGEEGNSAISRFHFTDAQRKAIADGADLYLELLHFKNPLSPSRLMVMSEPSESAPYFKEWWKVQTKGTYSVTPEESNL